MSIKGFVELHDYYTHAPFIVNVNAIESVSDKFIIYAQSGHNVDERYDEILKSIEAAQAADVAQVVHGKWREDTDPADGDLRCTHCGVAWPKFVQDQIAEQGIWTLQTLFKFCPNCGCKMDKEDET